MTPAVSFTPQYVGSLCQTLAYGFHNNIEVALHTHAGSHIGQLRELMVEHIRVARTQYDRMLWIDSDIEWTPEDFQKIISSPFPITVGAYPVSPDGRLSVVKQFAADATETCPEALNSTENYPLHFYSDELQNLPQYVDIYSSGFGFLSIARGVFGEMQLPYFANMQVRNPVTGEIMTETSEDSAWFLRARMAGFKTVLDTTIRLGHAKTTVWR